MPIPLQNIYTGQGTAVVLPEGSDLSRAQYTAQRDMMAGKQASYGDALNRQKTLLDVTNIPPLSVLTGEAAKKNMDILGEFKNAAKDMISKARQNGTELSQEDMLELQNMQLEAKTKQTNVVANEAMIQREAQEYRKNPSKYAPETAANIAKAIKTVEYPEGGLLVEAAPDYGKLANDFIKADYKNLDPFKKTSIDKSDKFETSTVTEGFNADLGQFVSLWDVNLKENNAFEYAKNEFNSLPVDEQQDWIDKANELSNDDDANALKVPIDPVALWKFNSLEKKGFFPKQTASSTKWLSDNTTDKNSGITFNFGGGYSKSDKDNYYDIKENLSTSKIGSGTGIKFDSDEDVALPASSFTWPEGYDPKSIGNVEFNPQFIMDGKIEGTVTLKNQPVYNKELTKDEYMAMPINDASKVSIVDNADGTESYFLPVKLDRTVTIYGDLDKVKSSLETKYEDFNKNLDKLKSMTKENEVDIGL